MRVVRSALCAFLASTATAAYSQTSAPSDTSGEPEAGAAPSGGLEEIVVTAQRRSENLQRVPITITALTGDTLIKSGVTDVPALAAVTPGLTLNNSRVAVTPFLRGVGAIGALPGNEPPTAIYVDSILIPVAQAGIFALANVERVEVLKGPQGTLFGRNAVGGIINVITQKPSETFSGTLEVGYGNYDTLTATGYVTGGLAEGVALDLSVYRTDQGDGWGRNYTLGVDNALGEELAIRSKLFAELDERTDVTLTGDYNEGETDIGTTRQALPGATIQGGYTFSGTIYDTFGEFPVVGRKKQYGVSVRVNRDVGSFDLQSTSSIRRYKILSNLDSDGYPLNTSTISTYEKTTVAQQEFILSGSMGRLDLTTGLYYYLSDARYDPFITTSGVRALSNTIIPDAKQLTNSYAAFGQATYSVTDSTRLTAGLRYTVDEREISGTRIAGPGHPQPEGTLLTTTETLPSSQTNRRWGRLTWRAAIDQQLSPTVLAFASVSRGFKSGVFNAGNPNEPAVNPEVLDSYEAGIKADLFDRSLRVNISAYHYNYDDMQVTVINAMNASGLLNAASARIRGLDGDVIYEVPVSVGSLRLRLSAAYVDGTFSSFPDALVYVPSSAATGGNVTVRRDVSGNRITYTPEFSSSAGVDYDVPIGSLGELGLTLTWAHSGSYFWDVGNRVRQDAYDLVSSQVSFTTADEKWKFRVFGRNLLDEEYYSYVSVGGNGDTGAPAAPRTYGFAIARSF